MGIKKIVRGIFGKRNATELASAVVAKLSKMEFKEGTIADAVADSIAAVANSQKTSREKFEVVVSEWTPVVLRYAASGGLPAAVADAKSAAEDLTRQLVQSVFNAQGPKSDVQRLIEALAKRFGL